MAADKGIRVKEDGEDLVIRVPFSKKGKVSKSGKSKVHASTNGNVKTEHKIGGKILVIGLNAYTPNDEE